MNREEALARDAADPLGHMRARFLLPEGLFYLDGNSLGPLPAHTPALIADAVTRQWGRDLIRSWNTADWIGAPQRIGAKIAPLIGAAPHEVIVADSVSVNLFKLLAAALALRPGRATILTEPGNFPTDLYIANGLAATIPGVRVQAVDLADIPAALGSDVAVLLLTHVHYKSAHRRDMAGLTAAAHAAGALVLWDLSHSAGAVAFDLNGAGADLAVGCGYKYLNGGPGAPSFLFAAERHHAAIATPLTGWLGHAAPFAFVDDYKPAPGMTRFLAGTPPMLSMLALEAGVDMFADVDMHAVEAKSRTLGDLLIAHLAKTAPDLVLASPRDPAQRGSHLVFRHPHAYEICQCLIERGVVGDFRAPDLWRAGLTPLTLSHAEVWDAASIVGDVMATRAWDEPRFRVRARVT
jgi:kynureninase